MYPLIDAPTRTSNLYGPISAIYIATVTPAHVLGALTVTYVNPPPMFDNIK